MTIRFFQKGEITDRVNFLNFFFSDEYAGVRDAQKVPGKAPRMVHLLARFSHVHSFRTHHGRVFILPPVVPRGESRLRGVLVAPEVARRVVYLR